MSKLPRTNEALRASYNTIYKIGKDAFFTYDSTTLIEQVLKVTEYSGKTVADFGCGEGDISIAIAKRGAHVKAYDYSDEAIARARAKHDARGLSIEFLKANIEEVKGSFDVVLCLGTFEHLDDPWKVLLHFRERIAEKMGKIIIACPSFLNPRGFVWMALQMLFDVPMSLTDIHFFLPSDFEAFAQKLGMSLSWGTTDFHIAHGPALITDFSRRLPNALRDANLPTHNVPKFIEWLENAIQYDFTLPHSGAMAIYVLSS